MCNNLIFKASSIASSGAGDTISLFNNNTTGAINMASNLVLKASSIGSSGINDTISLFSNLTTGTLNFVGGLTTGTLNIGNTTGTTAGSLGNIKMGNALNNLTTANNGTVTINKLQVGSVTVPKGIRGLYAGQSGAGFGSGSVSFGFTFPAIPIVVACILNGVNQAYNVQISSITTTGFNYAKWFNTIPQGAATVEPFNWIAICVD